MTTAYLLNHPQHVEHVLHTNHQNYRRSPPVESFKPFVGYGISAAEKELLKRQRKLVQPAFKRSNLEFLTGHVLRAAREHLQKWESKSKKLEEINLSDDVSELSTSVVTQAFFGASPCCGSERLFNAMQMINTVTSSRSWDAMSLATKLPSHESRAYDGALNEVNNVVEYAIRARRDGPNQDTDLLGILLGACDPNDDTCMNDLQLQDEIASLLVASFESTTSLLVWALSFLYENPHVLERVRNEADSILQGGLPTNSNLRKMEYTKRVIQEVARLRPTVWSFSRTAIEDDIIGGEPIKAGTKVLISQYVLHKLPAEWEDPERFDPDRFAPDKIAERSKFSYLPFGAGPRVCIASGLTMMEMQIILPLIYRKFDVSIVSDLSSSSDDFVSLKPKDDIRAQISARVRH